MEDNIDPGKLTGQTDAQAGYTGGNWPDDAAERAKFPGRPNLSVAVNASDDGEALDIEKGDATPAEAPSWFHRQVARGIDKPVFYVSLSQAQELVGTLSAAGIPRSAYWLWVAHYDNKLHICSSACGLGFTGTADGTQWTDAGPNGNDESQISTEFLAWIAARTPGAKVPAAVPPPAPAVLDDLDMAVIHNIGSADFITTGVTYRWIQIPAEYEMLVGDGHMVKGPVANAEPLGLPIDAQSAKVANDGRTPVIH